MHRHTAGAAVHESGNTVLRQRGGPLVPPEMGALQALIPLGIITAALGVGGNLLAWVPVIFGKDVRNASAKSCACARSSGGQAFSAARSACETRCLAIVLLRHARCDRPLFFLRARHHMSVLAKHVLNTRAVALHGLTRALPRSPRSRSGSATLVTSGRFVSGIATNSSRTTSVEALSVACTHTSPWSIAPEVLRRWQPWRTRRAPHAAGV